MMKTYTRFDISKKTGIKIKTISEYFTGRGCIPREKNRKLLADYLGWSQGEVISTIKKAQEIEKQKNPYKKQYYQNGTYKRIIWSKGDKISKDMFDNIV